MFYLRKKEKYKILRKTMHSTVVFRRISAYFFNCAANSASFFSLSAERELVLPKRETVALIFGSIVLRSEMHLVLSPPPLRVNTAVTLSVRLCCFAYFLAKVRTKEAHLAFQTGVPRMILSYWLRSAENSLPAEFRRRQPRLPLQAFRRLVSYCRRGSNRR